MLVLGEGGRPQRPNEVLNQSRRGIPFWDILQKCWADVPGNRLTASEVETQVSSERIDFKSGLDQNTLP